MITEDKLRVIYDLVKSNRELKTKELNDLGFSSYDLSRLIERGIIGRVKRGYYEFLSKEALDNYGVFLSKKETEIIENNSESDRLLGGLINLLLQKDFVNFYKYLYNYLKMNNKLQYTSLIRDIAILEQIENKQSFPKTINTLYSLDSNCRLNLDEYIEMFKECINTKQFEKARVYLGIISKGCRLNGDVNTAKELNQLLVNNMNNSASLSKPLINKKNMNGLEKFLNEQYKKINIRLITILDPMNKEKRDKIKGIVSLFPDMIAFSLGVEEPKSVVLQYKPQNYEPIDMANTLSNADYLYENRKYREAIFYYKRLMLGDAPKIDIYIRLAMAYLQLGKSNQALTYFKVADGISKKYNNGYDFTDIINKLSNKVNAGNDLNNEDSELNTITDLNSKSSKINKRYSNNNLNNYYGIDINSILELMSSGMTFYEACEQSNLDEEKKILVSILFAREYYLQGVYDLGDVYYQIAYKSKNKTPLIKELLEEVKINKRFYINRVPETHKVLTLVPFKKR